MNSERLRSPRRRRRREFKKWSGKMKKSEEWSEEVEKSSERASGEKWRMRRKCERVEKIRRDVVGLLGAKNARRRKKSFKNANLKYPVERPSERLQRDLQFSLKPSLRELKTKMKTVRRRRVIKWARNWKMKLKLERKHRSCPRFSTTAQMGDGEREDRRQVKQWRSEHVENEEIEWERRRISRMKGDCAVRQTTKVEEKYDKQEKKKWRSEKWRSKWRNEQVKKWRNEENNQKVHTRKRRRSWKPPVKAPAVKSTSDEIEASKLTQN